MKLALLLGLVLMLVPADTRAETAVPPAGVADLFPEGAYGAALAATLGAPSDQQDFAALRAVYAASPGYNGTSRIADKAKHDFMKQTEGEAVEAWSTDDHLTAIFADFPLLDTQIAAHAYFKGLPNPKAGRMADSHVAFYHAILKVILASEEKVAEGRRFKVLSIGEEYAVMAALKLKRGIQALRMIDGVAHDVFDTDQGKVLFDISAFFGKF